MSTTLYLCIGGPKNGESIRVADRLTWFEAVVPPKEGVHDYSVGSDSGKPMMAKTVVYRRVELRDERGTHHVMFHTDRDETLIEHLLRKAAVSS
jgi:hypothetical protein